MPDTRAWSSPHAVFTVVPMALDPEQRHYRTHLGAALKRTRKRLSKYTQESIGQILDVAGDTVGRWEQGKGEPPAYALHVMASRYGADGDLFIFPRDSMRELDEEIDRILLRRATAAAAARDAGDGPGPASGGGRSVPPGKGPRRTPPGSSR